MNSLARQAGYFVDVVYSNNDNTAEITIGTGISGLEYDRTYRIDKDDAFIRLFEDRLGQYVQLTILQHYDVMTLNDVVNDLMIKLREHFNIKSSDIITESRK